MGELMIVQIPVREPVKRYLCNSYFLKSNFIITDTDVVGDKLISLLEPPPRFCKMIVRNPAKVIEVKIPVTDHLDRRSWLSKKRANEFNLYVMKLIRHDFYRFMDVCVNRYGFLINDGIREFLSKNDFTDQEMTFDALKKQYYRHRERLESLDFIN